MVSAATILFCCAQRRAHARLPEGEWGASWRDAAREALRRSRETTVSPRAAMESDLMEATSQRQMSWPRMRARCDACLRHANVAAGDHGSGLGSGLGWAVVNSKERTEPRRRAMARCAAGDNKAAEDDERRGGGRGSRRVVLRDDIDDVRV